MRRVARAMFGGRGPRMVPDGQGEDAAQIAAAVRAERDHYHQMLAAATGDAIFTTSVTGVITFFNEGAERLLGYAAADVVGVMRGIDLHLPEEIAAVAEELGVEPGRAVFTTLAATGAQAREWTFVRADGSHVRVAHTVTTQRDACGRRRRLRRPGARHHRPAPGRSSPCASPRSASGRSPSTRRSGSSQTDEEGGCWYANRRFCALVGRTEDEVRGRGWLEVLQRRRPLRRARALVARARRGERLRRRVRRRAPRRGRRPPARDGRPDPRRRRPRDRLRHHHPGHLRARGRAAAPVGVGAALPRHARERGARRGAARRRRPRRLLQPAPGRDARPRARRRRRLRLVRRHRAAGARRGRARRTSARCAARSSCPTTRTRS